MENQKDQKYLNEHSVESSMTKLVETSNKLHETTNGEMFTPLNNLRCSMDNYREVATKESNLD